VGVTAPATTVVIPLGADDTPPVTAGERVIVWVSTTLCPSAIVLADVTVQSVQSHSSGLGSTGGEDVIVRVPPDQAQRVIQALALSAGTLRAGALTGSGPSS